MGNSPIEGLGMFAQFGFRRGDLLCAIQGKRVTIPTLKVLYDQGALRPSDPLQISERHYLVMAPPFIYVNHSCNPNTAVVGEVDLVALRPIDKGEEVTFDYAMTEWIWERFGRHAQWKMQCRCGSKSCEGHITQFPGMPLTRKHDYFKQGALPNHIIRKIVKTGLAYSETK